jgi:phage tail sheath gpL-like
MALDQSTLAAAVGVGLKNVQHKTDAKVLSRKILLIGQYDEVTHTTVVENTPHLVTSPEDVGSRFGWGFMLHRLAVQSFAGGQGVETWIIAQPEGAAVVATGQIVISGPATAAGTLHLYIAGIYVPVTVPDAATPTEIGDAIDAAILAKKELPVTSVNTAGTVAFTSKSKGPWGNFISLTFNWGVNEDFPAGVSAVVTPMASGTTVPDIQDALDSLGLNDAQNEDFFTDLAHGYLQDSSTLNKLSIWNGEGNNFVGNYSKTVTRPLRSINGDMVADTAGLTALVSVGNGRKLDRTSGIIAAPGSPNHPAEFAAWVMGKAASINNNRGGEGFMGQVVSGFIPGARADRWTDDLANRDTAVKAGIGTTRVKNNALVLSDVLTFYHPDNVPDDNNGYRHQVNISKLQNIGNSERVNFEQEKWQGTILVADTAKVSNPVDRQKARDTDSVTDDLLDLAKAWESSAWIYTAQYSIENLTVTPKAGNNGFITVVPVVLSGQGEIFDNEVQFDTSIAILL